MLNIINKLHKIDNAVNYIQKQDTILLVEEAIYAANNAHPLNDKLKGLICALEEDLFARGLDPKKIAPHIKSINMLQFVELTVQHEKSITW